MAISGLGRGRHRRKLNADVNIINLVDVVLVLLIIFMITAPMMQGAIAVELPRAVAAPPNSTDALVVTVLKNGQLKIGASSPMSVENVVATYRRMAASNRQLTVNVMGDVGASYGSVVGVLEAFRLAGLLKANLITNPVRSP